MTDDSIDADLAELRAEIAQFMLDAIVNDRTGSVPRAISEALQGTLGPQLKARIDETLPALISAAVEQGYQQGLRGARDTAPVGDRGSAAQAQAIRGATPIAPAGPQPIPGLGAARGGQDRRRDLFANWSRQSIGITVAALALLGVAVLAALFFLLPPRSDGVQTAGGSSSSRQTSGDAGAVDLEVGWDRILDRVQAWPASQRGPVLEALCGHGVTDRADCPVSDHHVPPADAATRARALAAMGRAMQEAGLCGSPPSDNALTEDSAANTAGQPYGQDGAANTASSPARSGAATRDGVWDCLVYGAARG